MKYLLICLMLLLSNNLAFGQAGADTTLTAQKIKMREPVGPDVVNLITPALAATYSLTLPTAVAAANDYCLKSSTAGVLSFAACTGGGSGISIGDTVTSGVANNLLYVAAGPTLGQITSANTSVLVTNSSGVPAYTSCTTANRVLRTNGTTLSCSQLDATTDITGATPIANGGTNSTATATAGGVGYGTGTAHAYTSAGTSGDPLISAGAGAPSFTTLSISGGTHVTGTLAVANGGTNLASGTSGGILGYTATGTLASSAALTQNFLVIGGGAGATPTVLADGNGTTTTVLHGNGAGQATWAKVSQTADISGITPIANGGTNSNSTPTAGGIAYGTGSAYTLTSASTAGYLVLSGGAGAPTFNPSIITNDASANYRIGIVYATCSSSSSIGAGDGTATAIGNISSGTCAVTVTGFSGNPMCTISITGAPTTNMFSLGANRSSNTNVNVSCKKSDGTTNCTSFDFQMTCMGTK